MSEALKPCPFCGSTNASPEGIVQSSKGQMFCNNCGAYGPHPAYDDSGADWNTRADAEAKDAAHRETQESEA
ncbi:MULTISPECIES: Lar family restriction alleviation protein [Halocynthiibacter]|uniref:Lar family restriction alleviation protein n=1 Tax=Halocynthiibacter halioticoli TaxID=2986804 RepID=A0AAE3J338_9RHOB|nr:MULTISPECIES: Lar family restriction alleviation protein [Halocynthiibacter]MCV6826040.1 Lar family restriction alleviation protein [Halocynthiibacter halioticoli]MCW4059041.1 Lar family restriction alleviation protein [Halocynthiibacter sp. SDUM655004]